MSPLQRCLVKHADRRNLGESAELMPHLAISCLTVAIQRDQRSRIVLGASNRKAGIWDIYRPIANHTINTSTSTTARRIPTDEITNLEISRFGSLFIGHGSLSGFFY